MDEGDIYKRISALEAKVERVIDAFIRAIAQLAEHRQPDSNLERVSS